MKHTAIKISILFLLVAAVAADAKESVNTLDELVVVGYGTQKRANATGAVSSIRGEMLESRASTNAVQALQGLIPGLNITNDAGGALDTEMNINIRGIGSIGEGSEASPLILIDGLEGDLASLNPDDIESVSVLKDASSAAIYGSRAPFGVILITTKNGSRGVRVNYSGKVRFQTPVCVPQRVDSYTMALMVNEAYKNVGSSPRFSDAMLERLLAYQRGELEDATEAQTPTKWKDTFQSWGNTDWYDVYMKDVALSQEHTANVSGGGDRCNYYFSANYLDQDGLFRYTNESFSRFALSAKVGIAFNDYVRVDLSSRLTSTDYDKPSALNSLFYHNLGRRYATEPLYLPTGEYHPKSLIQAMEEGGRERTKTARLYTQAAISVEPLKGWEIHADVNSRIEHNPYTRRFNPISVTAPNGDRIDLQVLEGVSTTHTIRTNGTFNVVPAAGESYYEKADTDIKYIATNLYSNYSFAVDRHSAAVLAGFRSEYYHREIMRVATSDVAIEDTPFIPSDHGNATTMTSERKGEWSSVGFFGRVNYNYDNRYLLEANMRIDGASRFPHNERWGYFPSVSVGWNIANESFWRQLASVCGYLKIRGSYGVLGNQNTSSFYPYYQQMSTSPGNVVLGGLQATTLPVYSPYSSSLTWEKIETIDCGVDFGFFANRLRGTFDWYQRTTRDMIGPSFTLPSVFGGAAPKTNNAELRTRGWELELSWLGQIGTNFKYEIRGALSDYSTVVTKYNSTTNDVLSWYAGKRVGEIWGYEVEGIAATDKEMSDYQAVHSQSSIGSNWGAGDLMYRNLDDNPDINAGAKTTTDHGDWTVIGNTTPRYAFSFTFAAQWRLLDFRAYFQGIGKRDFFIGGGDNNHYGTSTFFGFGGGPWQFTPFVEHLDYYRAADSELGENLESYYGRLRTDKNNIQYSDRFLQDASYMRLKNLTIGVSLPLSVAMQRYVKKIRLYLSAENLFTVTHLKIFDPEALVSTDAIYDAGAGKAYPQSRTFAVGVDFSF